MAAGKFGSVAAAWFLVDGRNLISTALQNLGWKHEELTEPAHGMGFSAEQHNPVGMARYSLTQGNAFFDTTAATGHAVLSAGLGTTPQATPRVICATVAGNTIGAPFVGISGMYQHTYEALPKIGELTKAAASYMIAGVLEKGVILQELEQKSVDWNTKSGGESFDYTTDTQQRVIPITSNSQANPTVITTTVPHGLTTGDKILIAGNSGSSPTINGERTVTVISTTTFSVPVNTSAGTGGTGGTFVKADSANGASGYLQVTEITGLTNCIFKIRDSADDTTYADLITFATVTAVGAERATVAGVVDRYLSVDGNVSGTGTITAMVGLCRS